MKLNIYILLGVSFSIGPILDYALLGWIDLGYKYVTVPIVQLFINLIFLMILRNSIIINNIILGIIISILIFMISSAYKSPDAQAIVMIINTILIINIFSMRNMNDLLEFFKGLLVSFFLISFVAQSYKIYNSGLSALEVRSGLSIYGSSYFVCIALLSLSIMEISISKIKDLYKFKTTIALFCLLHSLLFISRSGLFVSLMLLFFYIYVGTKYKKEKYIMYVFIPFVIGIVYYFSPLFLSRLSEDNNFSIINIVTDFIIIQSSEGQRLFEWMLAAEIIANNFLFGVGIGNYIHYGSYSNAHNFFLNSLAEFGLIFGGVFLLLFNVYPLIKNIKSKGFIYIFLITILFINTSGVSVFQYNYFSTNIIFILFLILLWKTNEKNIIY